MNYQRISYFIKAAETLNFSEAARQCYIASQSFGKQITLLEKELGGQLFDRTGKKIRLTPFGRECYDRFSGLVNALERTYSELCELASSRNRRVRIGIFSALSREKVVFPITGSMLLNFEEREISTGLMDKNELRQAILEGKADIGVTVTHDREGGWEDCCIYPLAHYPAQIAVSNLHPWFGRESVTAEEMRQCDFVKIYHPYYPGDNYYDHVPCRNEIEVDNYETMNMEVKSGRAFSVISGVIDEISGRDYWFLDLPEEPFEFTLALIVSRSRGPELEEMCRLIQREYEA